MQVNEVSEIVIFAGNEGKGCFIFSRSKENLFLVSKYKVGNIGSRFSFKGLLLLTVHCAVKMHAVIVFYNFVVLKAYNVFNRIIYSKACDKKRGTAAYPQYHHKETLLVSEQISKCYLV